MAEELRIQITAKDDASKVFRQVSDAASKVADELEDAGRSGEQGLEKVERGARSAAQEVDKIDDAAKRASVSFRDFDFAITAIGAGLTYAGNAALQQQQTIIGLQAAYGDAAQEMLDFADQMANVTIFNDDDILRGERYFATLRNNYDLSISQVQELMRTTADLASAYGTSFEDASSRITAAIRGEGEAAEYLGLTMNQQAIDRDNLTLTMSNQEAAQFRLNALYEQTGVYQGTATALAESEVGTRARLTNAIQDNAQAMANFVGPLVTQLAGIGMASTGLASMIGVFTRLGPAVRNSRVAMAALGLAFNPVTLGIAAVAGAGALFVKSINEQNEAADDYNASLLTLDETLEQLRLRGDVALAKIGEQIRADIDETVRMLSDAEAGAYTFYENLNLAAQGIDPTQYANTLLADFELAGEYADKLSLRISDALLNPDLNHFAYTQWVQEMLDSIVITAEGSNIDEVFEEILNRPFSDFSKHAADANTGLITFLGTLHEIDGSARGIVELDQALQSLNEGIASGIVDLAEWTQLRADLNRAIADGSMTEERAAEIIIEYANNANAAAAAAESMGQAFGTEAVGYFEDLTQRTQDLATAMLELSSNADYLSQVNLANLGTDATIAAEGIQDAATALDSVLAIYGQIDAMGNRIKAAGTIVDALFGPDGDPTDAIGPLRDVYDAGLIGQEQFNQAIRDGIEIQKSAAASELFLNKIRVDQLPILRETTDAYQAQIKAISEMNAQDQMVALGWMDEGMQGRIQQFADLGNELRALGPAGQEAMQQVVDGITSTDPVMTAMLLDLGLIKADLDEFGNTTYTIDMDAVGAMDSTERLIQSIDALTRALGGVPPLDLEVSGWEDLEMTKQSVYDLATATAQDLTIDIATRLTGPAGDGTGGADYDPFASWRQWAKDNPVEIDGKMVPSEQEDPFADIREQARTNPVDIPVRLVNAAEEAGASAGSALAGMAGEWNDITFNVSADTSEADAALADVQKAVGAIEGTSATIAIIADTEQAVGAITAMSGYEGVVVATAMVNVDGNMDGAIATVTAASGYEGVVVATPIVAVDGNMDGAIATVTAASGYEGVTVATAWVMVDGDNSDAVATINATAGYDGMTIATAYVDIVTRGNGTLTKRHGGNIPGYAMGGTIFEAGEAGPELAYFAGGGVALLPTHGLYMAPEGTYISPNNALNGVNVGGVTVNFNGSFYGSNRSELNEWAARELIPSFEAAIRQADRAMGA